MVGAGVAEHTRVMAERSHHTRSSRLRFIAAAASVLIALFVAAGCSDSSHAATSATAPSGGRYGGGAMTTSALPPPAAGGTTLTLRRTALGSVLVDPAGRTLYRYAPDSAGMSVCTGSCASAWPPDVVKGPIAAGPGLRAADFSVIHRADGSTQLAVRGAPLYTYAGDAKPGDIAGQNLGGVWHVVGADGSAIGAGGPGY
jgi:predicted lipoprotein with Yx(FWY)xxD motif